MRDIDNLCSKCFAPLTQGSVCGECGFDNDTNNDNLYLAAKTLLKGQYVVGAVLHHDSDAVSYAGYDAKLDKVIIIREFLPKGVANRLEGNRTVHVRQKFIAEYAKYKQSFITLWTTAQKLHNLSAIVPVYDVFEEFDTAYAIIEQMESISLREYLLRNPDGHILWDNARLMFMPVLTTIEALHANGIIHGSISPENLLLCADGKVRLKEFTIAQACDAKNPLEFNVNEGYTALEQYDNNHKICPATDIYAFSSCIYRALVGSNPPDAPARQANDKLMIPNSIAESIPVHVIKAMGAGLQVYPERRIQSITDFRELIDASPSVQAKSAGAIDNNDITKAAPEYIPSKTDTNKKAKGIIIALVVLVAVAIGVAVYLVNFSDVFEPETTTAPIAAVEEHIVPDFVTTGYSQSDIENNGVWLDQFSIKFVSEYSTDVEEGIIFKQSVGAGTTVADKTEIILTISKGIQTEMVPDVGGMKLDDAIKKLEELGFKVSEVSVYNDGTHEAGTVKSAYGIAPASGSSIAVGEEVIIQVYGEYVEPTTNQSAE